MALQQIDLERPALSAAARGRLEVELAELRAERAELAATVNDHADPVGDVADRADVLTRFDELDRVDRRVEEILLALERPVRAAPAGGLVEIGTTVTLRFSDGSSEVVMVGDLLEDDGEGNLVTPRSPLGRAVLGRSVGEEVTYIAPSGKVSVGIQAIGVPTT